jgi:hypothetical protein
MPIVSKSQNRFMHWAEAHPAEAKAEKGITPKVTSDFIASAHGKKLGDLPERIQHKHSGGAVTKRGAFRW